MMGPTASRVALRLIGLLLGGWSLVRGAAVLYIWDVVGRWRELVHIAALVLAGWAAFDLLIAVALFALRGWARYVAFITVALHFVLGWLLRQQGVEPIGLGIMVTCAVTAALLVLARTDEVTAPPSA